MADNRDFAQSPDMSLAENNSDAEEVTIKLHAYIGGRTLSVDGASFNNGADIIGWTDQGTADQSWTVEPTSDGYYRLINYNSLKALGVYGGSTSEGAKVVQWDWDNSLNQQWKFVPVFLNGTTYYEIVNRGSTLNLTFKGLTNDGCQAVQGNDSGNNELWDITCMTGELFSDKFVVAFTDANVEENTITVTVKAKNGGDYPIRCAFFNNKGILITAETKTAKLEENEETYVDFNMPSDCYMVQFYSWDEKTLMPLSKKYIQSL